jgi:uncharacterized protein
MELLTRLVEPLLESLIASTPVVIVEGGRASGKSTVCDQIIQRRGWSARLDLSDPQILENLRLDPQRFLLSQTLPCFIDEAQLEPTITVAVKRIVDQRKAPGQFVLTGSARLGRDALGGSDPLAGRAVRLRMFSLSQSELEQRPNDLIDRSFGRGWDLSGPVAPATQRNPWLGGLPGISGVLDGEFVTAWEREIATYVEAVLPLGTIGTRADLGRLLRTFRYFAANSGQLLNLARAASELTMQAATVRNHIDLLEASFLLFRIEAHRPAEHRVVTAHPRLFAADIGLATWAARAWAHQPNAALLGSLTESLVAHDVLAAAEASPDRIVVRHWRDARNLKEVDLLLTHPDGRFVPIEVKASSSVGPSSTLGLQAFLDEAGDNCQRALVIYEGNRILDLTPPHGSTQILAIPRSLM